MNRLHHWFCRSAGWKETLESRVPWVLSGADLGTHILEAGPGPGLTTEFLRVAVPRVTLLEADLTLAESLRARLSGTNVDVVYGDATAMPFPDNAFSSCAAFTMLHHVPSRSLQDQLLREAFRVLAPGGTFVGSESLQSLTMRVLHIGDTYVPVESETFKPRLQRAGFESVELETVSCAFRFRARKPAT